MEYEVVWAKVPKGYVRDGWQLVIGESAEGDCLVKYLTSTMYGEEVCLLLRPNEKKLQKPSDWNPPKMMEGWLTWDDNGGWWWWPSEPGYSEEYGWVDAKTGCGGDGQEIAVVMAKFLGCPDCNKFDERECIWEVGR